MLIAPILTSNINTSYAYNKLLKSINNRLANIVGIQYLNDTQGFRVPINIGLFNKLCEYKEILLDKLIGCNCLDDEHLIYITSRIQKLLDSQ